MTTSTSPRLALNERELAAQLGVSVPFLKSDRYGPRRLPFYRLGGCIRYNLDRVREALATMEEGGVPPSKQRKAG